MKKELSQKLINDFPSLYKVGESVMDTFYFGFECGDGWFELIYKLSEDIVRVSKSVRVSQVKEKFGTLRFYIAGVEIENAEEVFDLIEQAEKDSEIICETCGEAGRLRKSGWMFTACDKCYKGRNK